MSGARSFVDPLKLSEVVAAFGEGCVTTDEVARAYYKDLDIKKVVASVCHQYRLLEFSDDVFQEVCVRFVEKILPQMRDPKAVYGVIKATAGNICLDMLSRKIRASETSLDELIEVTNDKGDSSHLRELVDNRTLTYESIEQKMITEKACEDFSSRMSQYCVGERSILFPKSWLKESAIADLNTAARRIKQADNPKTDGSKFSEGTLFLQQLRDILGVTNGRLGELLSQTESVISYCLYTPRLKVPEDLMNEARSLFESLPAQDIQNTNFLAETPVPQIVDAWMNMLNIDPYGKGANEDFAAKIGVARSTVWRWRSERLKPKLSVLSHTHKLVLTLQQKTLQSHKTDRLALRDFKLK